MYYKRQSEQMEREAQFHTKKNSQKKKNKNINPPFFVQVKVL